MLNTEGNIMFSDFRYSKQSDEGSVTMCGPPEYFAPEVCQQLGHGMGCDFWSLGVVLYEVLFGDTPFTAKTDLDIIAKICRHKRGGLEKSDGVSKKCSNFLEVSERTSGNKMAADGYIHYYTNPLFLFGSLISLAPH